jgi:transglutaminase-like putative cysteine protease
VLQTFSLKNPRLEDTLAALCELAKEGRKDMRVRTVVEHIVHKLEPGDYASEAYAIYAWVCRNIRYLRDPHDVELVKDPANVLKSKAADCDEIATLLAAMLMSCGVPCRFCVVSFRKGVPSHVFCQGLIGGKWVTFDPVAGPNTHSMHLRAVEARFYRC